MRYSRFFTRTKRSAPHQESANAYLLDKAGYTSQVAAGVYALLPLAVRSLQKIEQIVREQMNELGGSEVIFSALQPKATGEQSGRWQDPNFRSITYFDQDADMTFGATHEEPMTQVVKETVQSYRDLPVVLYQFQTKFRKELRAKSGLLRGREFRMKDLYSFHPDLETHNAFYEQAAAAYLKTFQRLGLETYRVKASGGVFSHEYSDEFQVICPTGEDEILVNHAKKTGYNQEVEKTIPAGEKKQLERVRSIEVGNIFHLGSKYTEAFGVQYLDNNGQRQPITMGSYGIGITRVLGTLAELYHDEDGLKLPAQVAPFAVYLIDLTESGEGEKIEQELEAAGIEVLYDDRAIGTGQKLVDADLIGLPVRLIYSPKTAPHHQVELKNRATGEVDLINRQDLLKTVKQIIS